MVTGVPVMEYVERVGDVPLGPDVETMLLVESKVFPRSLPHDAPSMFPYYGTYLVTVPSLHTLGTLHRIVMHKSEDGQLYVYDPNEGIPGAQLYDWENMEHSMPVLEVTYMDRNVLADARYAYP